MVIEVFIPQSQAEDTLPQQLLKAVLDATWIASIDKAIGEPAKDTEFTIELLEHEDTSIAAQVAAVETSGQDLAPRTLQLDAIGLTVCLQGLHLFVIRKLLLAQHLYHGCSPSSASW